MTSLTETALVYPPAEHLLPDIVLREGRYEIRFARRADELDELLRLRFEVFNLELGEGLEASYDTGRDRDPFDDVCHHLIVCDSDSGEIVGTYRMQTSSMAAETRLGFYSSTEFDLSALPSSVLENAAEVGRACVALAHRNTQVLFLLWKGLAIYIASNQLRYLFGCCSLTSQDTGEALAVMQYLRQRDYVHANYLVTPQPDFVCYPPELESDPQAQTWDGQVKIPKLFRTYLRHGALVCGPPAIDREFKTIDYLVLFDIESMDEKRIKTFFG